MRGRNGKRKRNGNGDSHTSKRRAIHTHRQSLPIWAAHSQFITMLRQSPVLIVVGEPGSGKTTQIPQFVHSAGMGPVACTQPRRVAAITIAQRVALEMEVEVGKEVGYSVRFDDNFSKQTRIKYLTDGMLVQEAIRDPDLKKYKVIVVDEAHERSLQTDVLLGILKLAQQRRGSDLRLVIMSATLNAQKFSSFFEGARSVYIRGRQHPVELLYTSSPQDSYLDAALHTALMIHVDEDEGDILVFLTGQEEIESMARLIREAVTQMNPEELTFELKVCTIYAAMAPHDQMKVFLRAPPGTRKLILATNIAETSLTIPGVKFVVDTGVVKSRGYNPKTGIDSLQVIAVSKAQARQRSGRAGREGPGKAYRLYTEDDFSSLQEEPQPEIAKTDLSSSLLKLKATGVKDLCSFPFVDPPPAPALRRSLEVLFALGALDTSENLTVPLGAQLSQLPLDPIFGRVLLASGKMGCASEIVAILSMISTDNVFIEPREKQREAFRKRAEFTSNFGDHLSLLNIYRKYSELSRKERKLWCSEYYLNSRSMSKAVDIHNQLEGYCKLLSLPFASCGDNLDEVRRSLVCGLFLHAARRQPDHTYKLMISAQTVSIHPSSCLVSRRPELILFNSMVKTGRVYAREVLSIEGSWLPELVPNFFHHLRNEHG